ncbi:MAG: putative membrane protein [Rhodothermales bacterium]|jgi:putative membrane protein
MDHALTQPATHSSAAGLGLRLSLVAIFGAIWTDSFLGTTNVSHWLLENYLVFLFIGVLAGTFRRYQFSAASYLLICVFLCLHVYGAKHTYSENPFGFWLQDAFGFSRNHYDRIVHFGFGLFLAYPMREMFLKWMRLPKRVASFLPVEVTLSVSAFYELIEWAVADLFHSEEGLAFVGSQGDVWDAQKDIFLAVSGAVIALAIFAVLRRTLRLTD